MVLSRRDDLPNRAPPEVSQAKSVPASARDRATTIALLLLCFPLSCWGRVQFESASLIGLGILLLALLGFWHDAGRSTRGLQTAVSTLTVLGWLMIDRLDPSLGLRQAVWIAITVGLRWCWLRWGPDPRTWEKHTLVFGTLIVLLQSAVFLAGTERHGAKNWISIGGLSVQPGEFVKVLLVLFMAAFFQKHRAWVRVAFASDRRGLPHPSVWGLLFIVASVEGTLVHQKDLGMALLIAICFLGVFYMATGRSDLCFAGLGLGAVGALVAYARYPHVQQRFEAWLYPFLDPQGTGYQTVQAMYALSSGGLLGRGLGRGAPELVPEATTDFISAALIEEFGLLGFSAALLLLCLLVGWAFAIALASRDEFGAFLAAGLGTSFAAQTLLVVGGCLRVIPLTGMTLPFLSYGGSSLLASMIAVVLLEKLHAEKRGSDAD